MQRGEQTDSIHTPTQSRPPRQSQTRPQLRCVLPVPVERPHRRLVFLLFLLQDGAAQVRPAAATPSPRATSSFAPASASRLVKTRSSLLVLTGPSRRENVTLKLLHCTLCDAAHLRMALGAPAAHAAEPRPSSEVHRSAAGEHFRGGRRTPGKSDADIVQMLLDSDLNTAAFAGMFSSIGISDASDTLAATLAALATKVGPAREHALPHRPPARTHPHAHSVSARKLVKASARLPSRQREG